MENYTQTQVSRSRNAKRKRVSEALVPEPSGTLIKSKHIAMLVGLTPRSVGKYIRGLAEEKGIEADENARGKWRWK